MFRKLKRNLSPMRKKALGFCQSPQCIKPAVEDFPFAGVRFRFCKLHADSARQQALK